MDKEKGNGNTVLLTVIGVATLLVALVGATFAYFSATITSTAKESIYITTVNPIALKYVGQSDIKLENISPGESGTSSFTVSNVADSSESGTGVVQTYDLHLVIDENTLTGTKTTANDALGQLLVTVTSESTTGGTSKTITTPTKSTMETLATGQSLGWGSATVANTAGVYDLTDGGDTGAAKASTDKTLVTGQKILIGEVQTYSVNVHFVETNNDQNENQGKTFKAHFEVNNPKSLNE